MSLTNLQVQEIYAKRDRQLAYLAKQPTVHVMDLKDLDRIGCYCIACDFWDKCSVNAQEYLLNHQHPHVVSAAKLSQMKKNAG